MNGSVAGDSPTFLRDVAQMAMRLTCSVLLLLLLLLLLLQLQCNKDGPATPPFNHLSHQKIEGKIIHLGTHAQTQFIKATTNV